MSDGSPNTPSREPRTPVVIKLRRHRVHLLTAHLVLDVAERRLGRQSTAEHLADAFAFAVVATREDDRIIATALNRRFPTEAAVAALDRAVEALADDEAIGRGEFWRLHSGRVIVATDDRSPFTSVRFQRAVVELGCTHRIGR